MLDKVTNEIHVLKETSGSEFTPQLIDIIVKEKGTEIIVFVITEHTHCDLSTAVIEHL